MQTIVGLSYDMALRMARTGRAYIMRPDWRYRAVFICPSCQIKEAAKPMPSIANVFGLPADLPCSIVFRSSLMQIEVEPRGNVNVVPFITSMSDTTASDWMAVVPSTFFRSHGININGEQDLPDEPDIDVNNG